MKMIFFDLDDTLVDSEFAHLQAIKKTAADEGISADQIALQLDRWLEITDFYLLKYFRKEISLKAQRAKRIQDFWALLGVNVELEKSSLIYETYHSNFLNSCIRYSDTIACLESFKGFPMGIITNGVKSDQLFKLERNQLLGYFSVVIVSEEVGVAKPDPEIFRIAAVKSKIDIGQCIYLGNSFDLDYTAACAAGMQGYWLNRNSDARQSAATFHNLDDFANHIRETFHQPSFSNLPS